jgi:hypothetical protein
MNYSLSSPFLLPYHTVSSLFNQNNAVSHRTKRWAASPSLKDNVDNPYVVLFDRTYYEVDKSARFLWGTKHVSIAALRRAESGVRKAI